VARPLGHRLRLIPDSTSHPNRREHWADTTRIASVEFHAFFDGADLSRSHARKK
jgi:hypothetical protein